ncbi:RTA1 protein [Cadophora sp. MPI-SDFR-AT-0126]|nr:RTA1 protein [Leotiomycetes sp. MPI-SDFR-AT-0126]
MAEDNFEYYHYDPSIVAAAIFIVLFLATTALHCYQLLRTRTWFMIPLIVGGFFQWIGYVGRAISHTQTPNWTLVPYLIQTLLLLVAPALFAASIYMELSRIIILVDGESRALIKKKWLTKIFVIGDVLSFFIQGGGGGIQSSGSSSSLTTGKYIIVGGLFVQILFFGCFIAVSIHFYLAMKKGPTSRAQSDTPWRKHLMALFIGSALIMVRSLFRVIEYLQGFSGYLLSHEVYLYVFDAVLMFAVMMLFNVIHPSEVVALIRGGQVAKRGWKMEKIVVYNEGVALVDSGTENA